MVRNAKKKALYEVIIGARAKPVYEPVQPKVAEPQPAEKPSPISGPPSATAHWLNKPKLVQLNAGRIEFSIPYQVGIAVALGVLLTLIMVFRLGEWFGSRIAAGVEPTVKQPVNKPVTESPRVMRQATAVTMPAIVKTDPQPDSVPAKLEQPIVSTGKNRIVIQIHQSRAQLEPVKEYFDGAGVAMEILERNNWYYLVSKNRYGSIDKPGSDGYLARQKIIEVGAGYKSPAGFETFRKPSGGGPFSDAFGMKFED